MTPLYKDVFINCIKARTTVNEKKCTYDLDAFILYLYGAKNAMHMYDELLSYEYLLNHYHAEKQL
jgi:hypothetical protein